MVRRFGFRAGGPVPHDAPVDSRYAQWGRGQSLVSVSDETYGDVSVPLNGTLEISYIDPALAMSQMNAAAEAGEMEAGQ